MGWFSYFDLDVDRVNTPERPLPSGKIKPENAVIFGVITTLLGLDAAFAISMQALFLSLFTWGVGFLYNWKFKFQVLYLHSWCHIYLVTLFGLPAYIAGKGYSS